MICTSSETIAVTLRLALGCMLLLAGVLKFRQGVSIKLLAYLFGRLPMFWLRMVARATPLCELALGVWLLSGVAPLLALGAAAGMCAVFTLCLVALIQRGYGGQCACFGIADRYPLGAVQLGRGVVLLAAATVAWSQSSGSGCASALPWQLPLSVLAVALLITGMSALTYLLLAEVELFWRRSASFDYHSGGS